VTTARGKARHGDGAPLLVLERDPIAPAALVAALRAAGHARILCEGGPSLIAELVKAGLLDELFLTLAPSLFGRFTGDGRKSLMEGVDLQGATLELLSARQDDSHLFLRYARS
jgi:riboflavin biosynthesis pyrimidine reductase